MTTKLKEILDVYAQGLDSGAFKDWQHYRRYNDIQDEDLEVIVQMYAEEAVKHSLEKAAENAETSYNEYGDGSPTSIDTATITNPANIVFP